MPTVIHTSSDSDGGWKVVTKKTQDKGKKVFFTPVDQSNAYISWRRRVLERMVCLQFRRTPPSYILFLTWNIWGLNDPNKVSEIKRIVRLHSVNVLGILETKVKVHKALAIQKKFGGNWAN